LSDNENCSLKAYYYEGGCDFMGEWDNGSDDCYAPSDYKSTDDFWQDGIGSTLDDVFNITESMAEYEAEQEEEERLNEDVYKYSKGEKINIGEDV
jgi:GH24 family phage-related lysozyme (muramidase)